MLRDLSRLSRRLSTRLALDHDIDVNQFSSQGRHVVLEAESVFSDGVCSENIVSLTLAEAVEEDLLCGIFDLKINVEGATRLYLRVLCSMR